MVIKRLNDLKTKILAFTDSEYAEKKDKIKYRCTKKKSYGNNECSEDD